jgi:hypothetical protein
MRIGNIKDEVATDEIHIAIIQENYSRPNYMKFKVGDLRELQSCCSQEPDGEVA